MTGGEREHQLAAELLSLKAEVRESLVGCAVLLVGDSEPFLALAFPADWAAFLGEAISGKAGVEGLSELAA